MKKLLMFVISSLLLTGCHTPLYKRPPINQPSDDASIQLAEAANSVSMAMMDMARVEKNLYPEGASNKMRMPSTSALSATATVDWSGPVDNLVQRVANASRYHFRVVGKAPSIPVLVSITTQNEPLIDILRNLDYQAGKKAFIYVYPQSQTIELRYAKFYA
jgi:defect-in-organelle-trafficking protein DotD